MLFSGFLPGHRLHARHIAGALLGLAAATLLVWNKIGGSADYPHSHLGFALAFGCALVWSSYSVMSRLIAAVPSESLALPCFATALLALRVQPDVRDLGDAAQRDAMDGADGAWASVRSARRF